MVDIVSKINPKLAPILDRALSGQSLDLDEGYALIESDASQLTTLMWAASELRNNTQQTRKITYSRKIFLPLTNLCRDRCGYCTFVKGPEQSGAHTMSPDEVLKVALIKPLKRVEWVEVDQISSKEKKEELSTH